MRQISFIKSLMEFNKRVLHQGKIASKGRYSMNDLSNKLFFNKVFINNMQEMFQKFNVTPIIDDYIDELGQYIENINTIISAINNEKNDIMIGREDSFERRLSMEGKISDHLISNKFKSIPEISYEFKNDSMYYLSLFDDGSVMISYIDMRASIYKEVIGCQMSKYRLCWKTDDCIRDYIRCSHNPIDTVAIRITTSLKNNSITKVEYNGSNEIMKKLVSMFQRDVLVISNPFIYTDDIEEIIYQNIIETNITKPSFMPISIESLLDGDMLSEYPNDSFDKYLQFISLISKRNDVKSIYMTIYRIGRDPAIFYILRDAVSAGIKVHVNIELCATGESINTMWMGEMRKVGIDVSTYETGKYKVHSKLTLVEFNNGAMLSQIGTGNYHSKTSTQYTDLSLITSDADICKQVKRVFDILMGQENQVGVVFNRSLLVTRYNARRELLKLIDDEGEKGPSGYIAIKCNTLDDGEISKHLNDAANRGCIIYLIVRGVCTWIPTQKNVIVKSIIWDKLEHSRVYCFGNNNPRIYIGSLDPITKKIEKRIETLVLIKDPDIVNKLCKYLNRYITNITNSWIQTSSGMYIKE